MANATTIVDLQMVVDTSQVVKAREELKQLGEAAKNAAGASTTMAGANTTAAAATTTLATAAATAATSTANVATATTAATTSTKAASTATQEHVRNLNSSAEAGGRLIRSHAGVNRELLVLTHELSQGQFKRFGGSLLVLAEQTDALGVAMRFLAPLGIAGGAALGALAVTAGVLGYAAMTSHHELLEFNNALAITNNFAALTGDSFYTMSRQIESSTKLGFGAAIELTNHLAASGKVSASQIGELGTIIADFSTLSGTKIEAVTKHFLEMETHPGKFAREIDSMMNIFTPAQLTMIEHLENTGRKQEAALEIQKRLSDYFRNEGAQAIEENMHWWNRLDKAVGDYIRSVGKAMGMTNVSAKERMGDVDKEISLRTAPGYSGDTRRANEIRLEQLKTERLELSQKIEGTEQAAAEKETKNRTDRAAKNADVYLNSYKKNEERLSDEIAHIHKAAAEKRAAGEKYTDSQEADAVAQATRRFSVHHAKGRTASTTAVDNQQYTAALAELDGQMQKQVDVMRLGETKVKTLLAQGVIDEDEAAKQRRDIRIKDLNDEIDINRKKIALADAEASKTGGKKGVADKARLLADEEHLNAEKALVDAEYEKRLSDHQKRLEGINAKISEDIRKTQADRARSVSAEFAKMSMSGTDAAKLDQDIARENKYIALRESTRQTYAKESKSAEALADALRMLDKAEQDEQATEAGYAARRAAMQGDWVVGAKKAFADYQEAAANTASQTQGMFSRAAQGMEDSIVNFAMTGKLNFSSLTTSIISDIIRMEAKATTSKIVGWLGTIMGGGGGPAAAEDAMPIGSANGNAFGGGGIIPFAKGGVFDSTTMFPMAGGRTGMLGEDGPEAIMPLSRGADGKLGIKGGGGGSASVPINIVVNVQGGKDAQETGEIVSKKMLDVIQGMVQKGIFDARRVGGQLNPI